MKNKTLFFGAVALVASLQLAVAADVTGKITLKGKPPEEKVIEPLKADAVCGGLHKGIPKTRLYVVGSAGELADTIVYIKAGLPEGKTYDVPTASVELDQVACEYVPYVVAVQAKQKLVIKNSDPTLHNINAAGLKNNKPFNEAQAGNGPEKTKTFDNPERFASFACNVHPWMFSYVSVFEHPYFALTGKDGSFKLGNVPPGDYTIEAWHRKAGKVEKKIKVGADSQVVDFEIELKPVQ